MNPLLRESLGHGVRLEIKRFDAEARRCVAKGNQGGGDPP